MEKALGLSHPNYTTKLIGPDEVFNFRCRQCANCCKNVEQSVALEALDIFRISRYLKEIGDQFWRIEDILEQYTTLVIITEFGYPFFMANVSGPDDSCIFLKSGQCSIQNAKPRTCRMYPLTLEPAENGFSYHLIEDSNDHYSGPEIKSAHWMANSLNPEDVAFTKAEFSAAFTTGIIMREKRDAGVSLTDMLKWVVYFKYYYYDIEKPFLEQYQSNVKTLISILGKMKKEAA